MQCPDLNITQSLNKGQKRLDQAVASLGGDVVGRILGYSLYLFGYPYDFISDATPLSEPGIKTLVQDITQNGVERFFDGRRKSNFRVRNRSDRDTPAVKYLDNDDNYVKFQITGKVSLKIGKTDTLGKRLITLLFTKEKLMTQKDAAKILGCRRLAIQQNLQRLRKSGSRGILDNRQGQKSDYKFGIDVKGEIIKSFISSIFEGKTPTKTTVSKHLNEKFSNDYSERATALHLKKLGLTDNKYELILEIVRRTNGKIDSMKYLTIDKETPGAEHARYIESIRIFKERLMGCCQSDEIIGKNIFHIEKKVESVQKELQSVILKSVVKEIEKGVCQCPNCRSAEVFFYGNADIKKSGYFKSIKTGFGGSLRFESKDLPIGRCDSCGYEFDIARDILRILEKDKFTPLTQMKICSANRAGSYENAVRNLNELINLDINKNQVRKISNHVGSYITDEFEKLGNEIYQGMSSEVISQRHPLLTKLKVEKKYLNRSDYLICLAVDGGRMQLFDWIPPEKDQARGKKTLYWHENKVFRISIYDKTNPGDIANCCDSTDVKKVYKSARMIPGLTTYGATNKSWKETGSLIVSHLYMRGIKPEQVALCISDGSEHILKRIFIPFFPQATHILDYYHKSEALHKCLKSINRTENSLLETLKNLLWEGAVEKLIDKLKELQSKVGKPIEGKRNSDDPKVILDNFINHLSKNEERLRYKEYRNKKYPIGSGSVESAVKLFGKRIKGTEKQWNENGGESILALYAFLLSEDKRWKNLWKVQIPWM